MTKTKATRQWRPGNQSPGNPKTSSTLIKLFSTSIPQGWRKKEFCRAERCQYDLSDQLLFIRDSPILHTRKPQTKWQIQPVRKERHHHTHTHISEQSI